LEASDRQARLLLASVFVVAAAGLVYELIAGTLTTYLMGSSVTVFSIVIGIFMAAMGIGAWIAQFVKTELPRWFVLAELALALLGGLSALALFCAYVVVDDAYPVALGLICSGIGILVGLEVPILLRILEAGSSVRVAVSQVLALDYVGALVGSVLFPLVLLPHLGLVRTAAMLGLLNLAVAFLALHLLREEIPRRASLVVSGLFIGVLLVGVFATAGWTTSWAEDRLYEDPVVIAQTTPYQRVVITRWRSDVRLYLNGHLQFSSVDEHRYHEALVHPALVAVKKPERVLILGGGDGMAAREVLRHPGVQHVDLVDLDAELLELFSTREELTELNEDALVDPRVQTHARDAVRFLENATERWDAILIDLPDPNDEGLSRLYSQSTYRLALSRLTPNGVLVTQATSPFFAPKAFWCIVSTLKSVAPHNWRVRPYHLNVPSFGEWGFVMVVSDQAEETVLPNELALRFLNPETLISMYRFPQDMQPVEVQPNRLTTGVLAGYYREGWSSFRGQ
jgi:spermidine synthase